MQGLALCLTLALVLTPLLVMDYLVRLNLYGLKTEIRHLTGLVYHKFDGGTDGRSFLVLNTTGAIFDNGASGYFQGNPPTDSLFYQNEPTYNVDTKKFIAYCFSTVWMSI